MGCPIFKWYEEDGERGAFAINSIVEGSITLISTKTPKKEEYKARIVTYELEKRQKFFECAVDPYVMKVLEEEAENQPKGKARHYGLIIIQPGREKLSDSIVVDFISFHRHPTAYVKGPTVSRYGISAYTEVFDTLALKELALKEEQQSKKRIEGNLPPLVGLRA